MNKTLLSALLCLASFAQAQTEVQNLLKDPKIPWVTEHYLDLEDLHSSHEGSPAYNLQRKTWQNGQALSTSEQRSTTIQRLSNSNSIDWDSWLNEQILSSKGKKYADAQLSKLLSPEEISNLLEIRDSIVVFNPDDFSEERQIVINRLMGGHIQAYRLRLLYYYDASKGQLLSLPVAIAPLIEQFDDNGNSTGIIPLFWLPIKPQNKLLLPSEQPKLPLIRSIRFNSNWAAHTSLKSEISRDSMLQHFGAKLYQERHKILATQYDDLSEKPLSDSAIGQCFRFMAKLEVFDPNDLSLKIVEEEQIRYQPKLVVGLRDHHWLAWDPQQNSFLSSPYSIALIWDVRDLSNNLLGTVPMFHLYPLKWYKK